jgi:hypothetical protein
MKRHGGYRRTRCALALIFVALAWCTPGCMARLVVHELPYIPEASTEDPQPTADEELQGPVLAIDDVRLMVDGSEYSPASWVLQALVSSAEKSGVFEQVIGPADAELAPEGSVRATVVITDRYDRHEPFTFLWFMLSFLTYSLPTMLVPLELDLIQLMAVDFTLPSGEPLTYRLTTSVTHETYLVYVLQSDYWGRVLHTNLHALTKRLEQEPALRGMRSPIIEAD